MSSDVQVKDEPVLENEFNVETDSETEDDIEVDKLQPLDPKFVALTKFPIGCKVWYDLSKSSTPTKCLQAKSAYVVEAYIHFENRKQVYKVKSETTENEATLYEDRLIYGANCPVKVTNQDTNEVRNGLIICPKVDQGKDDDRKQRISYAIQFWQGEKVSIEFGVAAECVKYRMEVKASTDEGRRTVAAKRRSSEKESCDEAENRSVKSATNTKGVIQSTEAHQLPHKTNEEGGGQMATTKMPLDSLSDTNKLVDDENTSETEANERPKKVAKTTSNEKECTCVLTIPSWFKDRRGLFRHILGVKGNGQMGHNTRQIKSVTNCSVRVAGHEVEDQGPMTITIRSSGGDVTQPSLQSNVAKAIEMIEEFIVEFIYNDNDENMENMEKKILYELAYNAKGSYKFPRDHGFLLRKYDGVKKWCNLFDLPLLAEDIFLEHYMSMQDLKALGKKDCTVEVFFRVTSTSITPLYVLITGAKKKEVEEIAKEVYNMVRNHQCICDCRPKW